jgi:DNA-binding NarL/FixJ family response regulator
MKDDLNPVPILLVEGSPSFRRILLDLLERLPEVAVAGVASKPGETLAMAEAIRPGIILFDLGMPGPGGFDTLRRLRQLLPGTYIIATTFLDIEGYSQAALEAGANSFIVKVELDTDFVAAIRQARQACPP